MQINNDLRHDNCPLCAANNIFEIGNIEYSHPVTFSTIEISLQKDPELWGCRDCLSRFTQNAISEPIATKLYMEGIGGEKWDTLSFAEEKHQEIIGTLDRVFKKNGRVLDIGCNTGELLDFAKTKGCSTSGVEPCVSSRKLLEERGHYPFSAINEVDGNYDVITAFDLVEHLHDIPLFFEICENRLSKDGSLVIFTGDIDSISAKLAGINWWYYKYPEHIVFPSRKYFKHYNKFRANHFVYSYASTSFKSSPIIALWHFMKGMLKGNYMALPSIGADHMLVVLHK